MAAALSSDELRSLPVTFDVEVAGRAFGMGRTKTHEMVRAGTFPVRVLRLGRRYRVTRADLFRALGEPAEHDTSDPAAGQGSAA